MAEDEPVVKVTLTTIYDKLLDVEDKVNPVPDQISDHEVRIRAIEKYLWIWIGAAAVLGGGASNLVQTLITK